MDDRSFAGRPIELLRSIAPRVRVPGVTCRRVGIEPDGSVTLRLDSRGSAAGLRWAPPGADAPGTFSRPGIVGSFRATGLSPTRLEELLSCLSVLACEIPFLYWGPGPDEAVTLSPDSLGSLLRRQLEPGVTVWGPYGFDGVTQPSPEAIEFSFSSADPPARVAIRLVASRATLDGEPGTTVHVRRRDLAFARVEDTRDATLASALEHQVERLVGFAVGRALGRDPAIEVVLGGEPGTGGGGEGGGGRGAGAGSGTGTDTGRAVRDIDASRYMDLFHDRTRHEAFVRDWDAPDRWRRFHYPMERCVAALFRLGRSDHLVNHESLECLFNEPPWMPADASFFSVARGTRAGGYWQTCTNVLTDIRAGDVACGRSQALLEEAVEQAVAAPESTSVVVVTGCLPDVIGDNPVPVFRRIERATAARLYWISATNDYGGYTARMIRERLVRVAPPDHPRTPGAVALVGGGGPDEDDELLRLVGRLGLRPLGVILPDVAFERFDGVADASLFVWARQTALSDLTEVSFTDLPVTLLRPRAPVGVEGTLAWLRRIADHAPPASGALAAVDELARERPWEPLIEPLRGRAGVFDVAFVTDADEFELLYDTAPAYAYSLLDAVCEMGFGVRLLHFGDPGDRMRAYVADRGAQRRVTAAAFGDPASLRAGLAAPEVGIVFSHFTADPRAAAAGKPTFSEADIEMGFEGFVRTVDRLVRACERRPLAAFGRWLVGSGTGGGAT